MRGPLRFSKQFRKVNSPKSTSGILHSPGPSEASGGDHHTVKSCMPYYMSWCCMEMEASEWPPPGLAERHHRQIVGRTRGSDLPSTIFISP